ncbi:hypothetical protein ACH5RR_003552 [Cinchona calisaya]|uniref:Smr domain-containing protein n=1 Tax=Cinchona calisaya TaxID=153742 RepID=A0ABD3AV61_9GENT
MGKHSKVVGDGAVKFSVEALLNNMGAPFRVVKINIEGSLLKLPSSLETPCMTFTPNKFLWYKELLDAKYVAIAPLPAFEVTFVQCILLSYGKSIGSVLGLVQDVIVPNIGSKEGRDMKILVKIDISQPLMRGTMVKLGSNSSRVDFKYKRCPDLCYKCGVIGHNEKIYRENKETYTDIARFGSRLKANSVKSPSKLKIAKSSGDQVTGVQEEVDGVVASKIGNSIETVANENKMVGAHWQAESSQPQILEEDQSMIGNAILWDQGQEAEQIQKEPGKTRNIRNRNSEKKE